MLNKKKFLLGALALSLAVGMFPALSADAKEINLKDLTSISSYSVEEKHPHIDTAYIAIGEKRVVLSTPDKNDKVTSSDESVATVSRVRENGEYHYSVKCLKMGEAHLKIVFSNGEKYCLLVKVSTPVVASSEEVTVKAGSDAYVNLSVISDKLIDFTVSSSNKEIATAKITGLNPTQTGMNLRIAAKKAGKVTLTIKNKTKENYTTIKVTVTKKDTTSVPIVEPTGKKRALVIGQLYSGYNTLVSCPKDAAAVGRVCKNSGYTTTVMTDLSKKKMQSAIANTFKDAKKNDVSYFYYSGHGAEDGSLCTSEAGGDIDLVSPRLLAKWLSNIPGKVIVVLDNCFSGSVIGKEIDGVEFVAADANHNIINAFSENDPSAKSAPLAQKKFTVLTACTKNQYSYCTDEFGFFTKTMINGAGFNFENGKKLSVAAADTNKDKKLTADELANYTKQFALPLYQNAQCYPAHSGMKIFQR